LNLKVYDEYLQKVDNGVKSFDGGISLRAKGALKSIGATKIVKLVETLDTRAEFAATAIEKINKTNQEEVKEIFAYLYGLTNAEFKNYKVERAGSSNLAYSIATYYRLLKNNVYDNAGVGVTKSEAFNQALLQRPASNFVNTVFDSDINRGKIASTVRQSKLFDLAGIKLTNPNAGEFLKGEYNIANREKQAKD
jgi:hypothetical protein